MADKSCNCELTMAKKHLDQHAMKGPSQAHLAGNHSVWGQAVTILSNFFNHLLGIHPPASEIRTKPIYKRPGTKVVIDLTTDSEPAQNDVVYLYTVKQKTAQKRITLSSPYQPRYASLQARQSLSQALCRTGEIHETQAQDLINNKEISTFTVDSYFDKLCKKDPRLAFLESGRIQQKDLLQRLKEDPHYLRNPRSKMQTASTIFIPICSGKYGTSGNHFYLVMLKKTVTGKFNLYCLDGFNSDDRAVYLNKAKAFLACIFTNPSFESLIDKTTYLALPKQTNLVDCGPVICYWASQLAFRKEPFNLPQGTCDYSAFRLDIAQKLIEDNNISDEKPKNRASRKG